MLRYYNYTAHQLLAAEHQRPAVPVTRRSLGALLFMTAAGSTRLGEI